MSTKYDDVMTWVTGLEKMHWSWILMLFMNQIISKQKKKIDVIMANSHAHKKTNLAKNTTLFVILLL